MYHTYWNYAKEIKFVAPTTVNNEDVLVILPQTFDYSFCKSDGSDLRFYGAGGGGTALLWLRENWNPIGETYIWVRVPTLGTTSIQVEYGYASAPDTQESWTGYFCTFSIEGYSGWTLDTSYDNYFLMGHATPGTTGGSDTHTHAVGTLAIPNSPVNYITFTPDGVYTNLVPFASNYHYHSIVGDFDSGNTKPPYFPLSLFKYLQGKIPLTLLVDSYMLLTGSPPQYWMEVYPGYYIRIGTGSNTYLNHSHTHAETTVANVTITGTGVVQTVKGVNAHSHPVAAVNAASAPPSLDFIVKMCGPPPSNRAFTTAVKAVIPFLGSIPPLGWLRWSALDDRIPRVGTTYGVTAGSTTHTHTANTTAKSPAMMYTDASGLSKERMNEGAHTVTGVTAAGSSVPLYKTMLFAARKVSVAILGFFEVIAPPTANFKGVPRVGNGPDLVVNFYDQSIGTPTAWDWDYGDGTAHGTTQNPQHTYSAANPTFYTVTLKVTNASSSATIIKQAYIYLAHHPPVLYIAVTPETGAIPQLVNCSVTDSSYGPITNYDWDWGDNTTHGSGATPSHTYTVAGVYQIICVATNAFGDGTATTIVNITTGTPEGRLITLNGKDITTSVMNAGILHTLGTVISTGTLSLNKRRFDKLTTLKEGDKVEVYKYYNSGFYAPAATPKAVIPVARDAGAAILYNNKVWYAGGYPGGLKHYSYDIATNAWSDTPTDLPAARWDCAGKVVGQYFYIIGGSSDGNTYTTLYRYDLINGGAWVTLNPMTYGRAKFACAVYNNKIYVFCSAWFSSHKHVEVYDIGTGNWTTLNDIPNLTGTGAPYFLSAVTVGAYIYLLRYSFGAGYPDNFYRYNPADDTYLALPDLLPTAPSGWFAGELELVANGNKIYHINGTYTPDELKGYRTNKVFEYDIDTNAWTEVRPTVVGRGGQYVAKVAKGDGGFYLIAGRPGNGDPESPSRFNWNDLYYPYMTPAYVTQHQFSGFVKSYETTKGTYEVVLEDHLITLTKYNLNTVYGSPSYPILVTDVFTKIIEDECGMLAVVDSSTAILQGFKCKNRQAYEACQTLCDSLYWQMYYDPRDNKVHVGPRVPASITLDFNTDVNVAGTPKWNKDLASLYNDVTVTGKVIELTTTEQFTLAANGKTSLALAHKVKTWGWAKWGTVLLTKAVAPPTEGSEDYYVTAIDDQETLDTINSFYIYHRGTGTPQTGDIYTVQYTYEWVNSGWAHHQGSIDEYNLRATVVNRVDLETTVDLQAAADSYLENHRSPVDQVEIKALSELSGTPFWIGNKCGVIDGIRPKDRIELVVIRWQIHHPSPLDDIQLGVIIPFTADYLKTVDDRLRRLEQG